MTDMQDDLDIGRALKRAAWPQPSPDLKGRIVKAAIHQAQFQTSHDDVQAAIKAPTYRDDQDARGYIAGLSLGAFGNGRFSPYAGYVVILVGLAAGLVSGFAASSQQAALSDAAAQQAAMVVASPLYNQSAGLMMNGLLY